MRILVVHPCQNKLPVDNGLIRADTTISIPLAEGLREQGHDVQFLTAADSELNVEQIKTDHLSMFSVLSPQEYHEINDMTLQAKITKLFFLDIYLKLFAVLQKERFDIVHIHTNHGILELLLPKLFPTQKFVFTLHSSTDYYNQFAKLYQYFQAPNSYYVSLSNNQQKAFPYKFIGTVYNGINLDQFPFAEHGGNRLLFAGRIRPEKGPEDAIKAAVATQHPIVLTGHSHSHSAIKYFQQVIDPLIKQHSDQIEYSDFQNRELMHRFYRLGKLILAPVLWQEPFGLVITEAMACGTPVVAYANGSVPEIIEDGKTGFIIDPPNIAPSGRWLIKKGGVDGLVEAINRIYAMNDTDYLRMRQLSHDHVAQSFTTTQMVDGYIRIYQQILNS